MRKVKLLKVFLRMIRDIISPFDPTGKVDWKKIANTSMDVTPPSLPPAVLEHLK
jgi:hypothetical protein